MHIKARIVALSAVLVLLFMAIGYAVGYYFFGSALQAMIFALVIAVVFNFFQYFYCDKVVILLTGAKIVDPRSVPRVHRIVKKLSEKAGIPEPRIAIVPSAVPNAFATGRSPKKAVVAVTRGALQLFNDEELEGVLAHEIAHIVGRDILLTSIVATVAAAAGFLATMGRWGLVFGGGRREEQTPIELILLLVALIVIPIVILLVRLAISRSLEYRADEKGARICGKPEALARALSKIERVVKRGYTIRANPSTSSLWIVNPFRGDFLVELFSTHPSTEKRVARLLELAKEMRV